MKGQNIGMKAEAIRSWLTPKRRHLVLGLTAVAVMLVPMLACSLTGGQPTPDTDATAQALARLWATQTAQAQPPTGQVVPATATLTFTPLAAPPSDTPTWTPTSVPPTGTSTAFPTTTPAPTDTPTRTYTPTPTQTPAVTPTPPPCAFGAEGEFAALWQNYKQQLGCPLAKTPHIIQDAEQEFDNGHMFWRQDNLNIYVVYDKGSLSGDYSMFIDTWKEGDPPLSCQATPPPGRVQPTRGFGKVWCLLGDGSSAVIGWGLAPELGFGPGNGDPLVQDFEAGVILRDSAGTVNHQAYVFFADTNSFVHAGY
jgi:hypothetical protein